MKFLIFLFSEIVWGFTYDGQIEISAKLFDFKRTLKKETFEAQKTWCEGEGESKILKIETMQVKI